MQANAEGMARLESPRLYLPISFLLMFHFRLGLVCDSSSHSSAIFTVCGSLSQVLQVLQLRHGTDGFCARGAASTSPAMEESMNQRSAWCELLASSNSKHSNLHKEPLRNKAMCGSKISKQLANFLNIQREFMMIHETFHVA